LAHPNLSAAYPDTKNMAVRMKPGESTSASYFEGDGTGLFHDSIALSVSPKYNYKADPSTMLHEIQHAVQKREGFARGGNPKEMGDEMGRLRDLNEQFNASFGEYMNPADEIQKMNARQKMDYLQKQIQPLKDLRGVLAPEEAYARLAGEAEARATQARMPLDAAQRRALFPEDSYDVPMNQLIVRGLLK
jgi:hypothetical protein